MIVKKGFFCIQEQKAYKKDDVYTGKRTDLSHLLTKDIEVVAEVVKPPKKRK